MNTDPSTDARAWPPVPLEAWRERALRELQGAPLERLVSRTAEGLRIEPLYPAEPTALPGRASLLRTPGWAVCPEYTHPDPAAAGAAIAVDLQRGAGAVWVRLDERLAAGVAGPAAAEGLHGVALRDAAGLGALLAGVDLARTHVTLAVGAAGRGAARLWTAVAARRGVATASLRGLLGCDPLGALARRGGLAWPIEHALSDMSEVAAWARAAAPGLRAALVDVGAYHDAGASAADQLAALLATGVAYLRALTGGGADVQAAAQQLGFAVAVGRDLFLEIAKLRAARLCWARVVAACGGDAQAQRMHLHARGSWRERTTVDPWVGLLRGTGETFAAALGGADSIATTAMDAALGEPGELGRRMALNTQLVLAEESQLGRIADPAGGAGYVEALTDQLARAAWTRFQAIERAGGMAAALRSGQLQQAAQAQAQAQAQAVATLRLPIVGVSRFAAAQERDTGAAPAADPLAPGLSAGTGLADGLSGGTGPAPGLSAGTGPAPGLSPGTGPVDGLSARTGDMREGTGPRGHVEEDMLTLADAAREAAPPLLRARLAGAFEALRGRSRGDVVALVAVGEPAQWRPRVEYCRAYLGVGGFGVVETEGATEAAAAAASFAATGARAAVICSTDEVYPALVPELAPRLRAAGATVVLLAGRPKDPELEQALAAAGVELFVQHGGDALALLGELQRRLEVRP